MYPSSALLAFGFVPFRSVWFGLLAASRLVHFVVLLPSVWLEERYSAIQQLFSYSTIQLFSWPARSTAGSAVPSTWLLIGARRRRRRRRRSVGEEHTFGRFQLASMGFWSFWRRDKILPVFHLAGALIRCVRIHTGTTTSTMSRPLFKLCAKPALAASELLPPFGETERLAETDCAAPPARV